VQQTVTVEAGETMKLGDVFLHLFGIEDGKGALRFQSPRKVVVSARSYNLTTAGLAESRGHFLAGMPVELAVDRLHLMALEGDGEAAGEGADR